MNKHVGYEHVGYKHVSSLHDDRLRTVCWLCAASQPAATTCCSITTLCIYCLVSYLSQYTYYP